MQIVIVIVIIIVIGRVAARFGTAELCVDVLQHRLHKSKQGGVIYILYREWTRAGPISMCYVDSDSDSYNYRYGEGRRLA